MGRRALKKSDPNLDLSGHLVSVEQLLAPADCEELFGRTALLEVEVGSGKGLFLATAAAADPQRDFLGIEVSGKYARHIAGRLAFRAVGNARVVHGDASRVFGQWLAPRSVAAVHIYFPDPWWKKRHHKRRIMNAPFLRRVAEVLSADGALHFWTDVREYFERSLGILAEIAAFEGPLDVAERPAEHDLDYRTHFERRTRRHALPVYRAEYRRR